MIQGSWRMVDAGFVDTLAEFVDSDALFGYEKNICIRMNREYITYTLIN